MPMHDWTRVDPNDYHDFHYTWIAALKNALNDGRLPPGYFAMADHTVPPIIPDVITLALPDARRGGSGGGDGGTAVAAAPPKARFVDTEAGKKWRPAGRRRIAIRHA